MLRIFAMHHEGADSGPFVFMRLSLAAIAVAMTGYCAQAAAQSADPEHGIQIFTENDLFSRSSTDQWYTNGLRIVYLPRKQEWQQLEEFGRLAKRFYDPEAVVRVGFTLGQDIYTPRDIRNPAPQPWDRPWAGWTYIGAIAQAAAPDTQDTVELNIGAVGPKSGARSVQTRWHELIGAPRPEGWGNQIGNELGVNLTWKHQIRRQYVCNTFDLIPHYGLALGNVYSYAAAGATLRLGRNLSGFGDDRSVTSLRRGASISGFCLPPERSATEFYLFARTEGRLVARNIFLDGNTFRDSANVTKRPWAWDVSVGASLRFMENFRLTFTQTWRSMEFKPVDERTPRGVHRYGTIVAAYEF
ncbi:MAG: lipid A deacylase LpxR family protein [Burkholderiales bacterium]|nr:lipid A deacylase LpxR family protein [Burkholderiales bacterium]